MMFSHEVAYEHSMQDVFMIQLYNYFGIVKKGVGGKKNFFEFYFKNILNSMQIHEILPRFNTGIIFSVVLLVKLKIAPKYEWEICILG